MTVFQKIIDGELPAKVIYDDAKVLAFEDQNPVAPTHILVIPKKPISQISEMGEEDEALLGYLMGIVKKIAEDLQMDHYRLVVNNGANAGQTVFHLHVHLIGGRTFAWPPG